MTYSKPLAAVLSILLSVSAPFPYADAAGRSTTAAINTILNGKGAPKSSLGIDGDFYIDARSLLLYGPKAKGKWPTPQNLKGPTGPSGVDGRNGSDGKSISNANVNTVVGPQGPQGIAGPQGEKGEPGLPGATGVPGPAGSPGPAGPAGANGSSGPSGPQGATGPAGPTGAVGPIGPAGAKGDTGTVGPSEVTVIDIPEITLSTTVPFTYATSAQFGNLIANRNYQVEIFLRGSSTSINLVLGIDLVSAGNTVISNSVRSDFTYATYSSVETTYGFHVSGAIRVGATDSSFTLRLIDGRGETGSAALRMAGKAYITLVGQIK